MLEQLLTHLHNWFVVPGGIHSGTFTIQKGSITLPFLLDGQYFRICGSLFNDGLHQCGAGELYDEQFTGEIWALAIPPAVISITKEIEAWQEKNGDAANSPYTSESFGGYSYSKAKDAQTGEGVTWQSVFRSRLHQWRKL